MECLRNYIGIHGCDREAPESGLYIESLPGISLESIDKLANSEQKTYLKVFDDAVTRALRRLSTAIDTRFKKRYQIRNIAQSFDLGKKIDASTTTAAADELRGFAINCDYPAIEWLTGSSLRLISVQELNVYIAVKPGSANVPVKIIDLDSKEVLFTKDILNADIVVGWNRVAVNQAFTSDRIYNAVNAKDFDTVSQEINPLLTEKFASYINAWVGDACSSCDPCRSVIQGLKASNDLSTKTYGSNSFGVTGIFSIICKYDGLVCANKAAFAEPLWYLIGSEIQVDRAFNKSRNNKWTQDPKEAFALKDYFDSQFEERLDNVIDGIDLNLNDICLKCNQDHQIVNNLP